VRTEKGDRVKWVFDYKPSKPLWAFESFIRPEDVRLPEVVISTGKSWADVAACYATTVDRQIDLARVKGFVREELGGETRRKAVIAKLLAAAHRLVRYTGLEFGEASIVPRSPSDTLARRYGDCKDQAVLLVAMLRAAGVPAHLALLNVDAWQETLPNHPALDVFNHVIVYVPGDPPLWIDLTAEYYPCDCIPFYDQGCLALIVAPTTRELVRIPRSDRRDSFFGERWELDLTQDDARVRYREISKGPYAAQSRARYAPSNKEDLRKWWGTFFRSLYKTDKIERLQYKSLEDVSQPLVVEVDAAKAKIPVHKENESEIAIVLRPNVLNALPRLFFWNSKKAKDKDAGEEEGDNHKRRLPLQLGNPHVYELQYRMIPPPGFVASTMPKELTDSVGPVTVTSRFKRLGDGSVEASFRLDPGPGLFTAEEVESLRDHIASCEEKDESAGYRCKLLFRHAAAEMAAAGQIRNALAEHQATIKRHPQYAGERFRYADTLLKIGMGEAARSEARKGAELSPNSGEAQLRLGEVLSHDLFGELHGTTMDWQGAADAFKKAIDLDPADGGAHYRYGILLEFSPDGLRYCSKRLAQAADEYRKARKSAAATEQLDINLGVLLIYNDRAKEIEELGVTTSSAPALKSLLIAAVAAGKGLEEADKKTSQLVDDPTQRALILVMAGDYLNRGRFYTAAREFYERTGAQLKGLEKSQMLAHAKLLSPYQRVDCAGNPKKDVRSLLCRVMTGLLQSEPYEELRPFLADGTTEADFNQLKELWRDVLQITGFLRFQGGIPAKRVADALMIDYSLAGGSAATGYHVRLPQLGFASEMWFVVPDKDGYRVICPDLSCIRLGAVAMRFLDAHKPDAARQWLDWAYAKHKDRIKWLAPFSGSAFGQIWWQDFAKQERTIRLAAAALLATDTDPTRAIAILTEQLQKKDLDENQSFQVRRALAIAYNNTHQYSKLLTTANSLLAVDRHEPEAWTWRAKAMCGMGHAAEACKELIAELTTGLEPRLESDLAFLLGECGDIETARSEHWSLVRRYPDNALFRERLAWLAVAAGGAAVDKSVIEHALAAAKSRSVLIVESTNILAAVYAEQGDLPSALSTLRKSLELRSGSASAGDWYILGRIAEQYGLHDAALSLYRKIKSPDVFSAASAYELARRRIRVLEKP
jgi:tetratricopeptide (TPR) repeat protein